jgi:tetratricopeptide (TPR) repeat protein
MPDMGGQLKELGQKIDNIKMFDVDAPIRELQKKIDDKLGKHQNIWPDIQRAIDESMKTQVEWQEKVAARFDSIDETMKELQTQHDGWQERLNELANRQGDLTGYLEEGKKLREKDKNKSNKKDAKKYNNLGVASFHNGVFDMAKSQFLEAIKLDPEFAEAYNNLGLAYTEIDEEEQATEAFSKAVSINPELHAAYNNLGYIFFKQGNYDQAIEMYNESLGRSTDSSSAYTNLGNAYYKLDKIDDARTAWEKALELDPGNEKARRNLQRISEDTK